MIGVFSSLIEKERASFGGCWGSSEMFFRRALDVPCFYFPCCNLLIKRRKIKINAWLLNISPCRLLFWKGDTICPKLNRTVQKNRCLPRWREIDLSRGKNCSAAGAKAFPSVKSWLFLRRDMKRLINCHGKKQSFSATPYYDYIGNQTILSLCPKGRIRSWTEKRQKLNSVVYREQ